MIASRESLESSSSGQNRTEPFVHVDVGTLKIRRMRPDDVPGVMTIESVSFGRHHWTEESFLNEMNNPIGRYFSLFDPSGELIGYAGFWNVLDEAHVTTVAVEPKLRGNALGEVLFLQLLEHCYRMSVRWVTLEVRTSNHSAQNLYYKYGLQSVGVRPKYYQDNQEDALIMTTPSIVEESYRALYNQNKAKLLARIGACPIGFGV